MAENDKPGLDLGRGYESEFAKNKKSRTESISRMTTGLLSVSGALFITTLHLIVTARSAGDLLLASEISRALIPFLAGTCSSLASFAIVTFVLGMSHDEETREHFKRSLDQSVFFVAFLSTSFIAFGTWQLVDALVTAQ